MSDYYFEGDPAVDSTRRHLERVLQGRQTRHWPWLVAALAGGAAFAFWRIRSRRVKPSDEAADTAVVHTPGVQHAHSR